MPLTQFRPAEPLSPVYAMLATLPRGAGGRVSLLVRALRLSAACVLHAELDGALEAARQRLQRPHPRRLPQDGPAAVVVSRRANRSASWHAPTRATSSSTSTCTTRACASVCSIACRCIPVPAAARPGRQRVALRNRRLAQLALVLRPRDAAHVAARHRSAAPVAPRQRRYGVQYLGRRVGRAPAAARSAAFVRRADLLSRARHAGLLRAHGRAGRHGRAAAMGGRLAGARLQPADLGRNGAVRLRDVRADGALDRKRRRRRCLRLSLCLQRTSADPLRPPAGDAHGVLPGRPLRIRSAASPTRRPMGGASGQPCSCCRRCARTTRWSWSRRL